MSLCYGSPFASHSSNLFRLNCSNKMAKSFGSHLFKNLFIQSVGKKHFSRTFHVASANMVQIGDAIPSVELYENTPTNAVNIADLCKGKKVVLFGVPGAFTPACSRTHLPGFVERYLDFKKKGVNEIVCVSVNDVFVMDAWGKDQDAAGKVRLLADPYAVFTTAIGVQMVVPQLGGVRSKRYSMVIDDGIVSSIHIEPDGMGVSCSLADNILISCGPMSCARGLI